MPFPRITFRIGGAGDRVVIGFGLSPGDIVRRSGPARTEGGGITRTALPQPIPPQPTVGTPPTFPRPVPVPTRPPIVTFPTVPAANDPVFSLGKIILRRGLAVIGGVLTALDILKLAQIEKLQQVLEETVAVGIRGRIRLRGLQTPREVVIPEPTPVPEPEPLPEMPGRPDISPLPQPDPLPDLIPPPVRVPLPVPVPPTIPSPVPIPRPSPIPLPSPLPVGLPNIRVFPLGLPLPGGAARRAPLQTPISTPVSDPVPLTPVQPGVVGFQPSIGVIRLPQPQPAPQPATERCQIVKRRRRKRGKCAEGFYRETATGTQFIKWREINCVRAKFKEVRSKI